MKIRHILYSVGVLLGGAAMVGSAGALSSQRETDFYFTFTPTIGLSLSNSKLIISDLAPGNAAKSNEIVLTVNSNNPEGFYLTASVGDNTYNTTSLVNGSAEFTNTTLSGVSLTGLNDNTWGYTMGTDEKYYGLPLYNATPKVLFSTNTPESITKTFAIGAKAASIQTSGEYKNVINFELVGNVSGNPNITLQAGEGGTVSVSPTGQITAKVGDVIYQGSNNTFTLVDGAGVSRTITATPDSRYAFSRWTTTCGATVSGDCTVTAEFKLLPCADGTLIGGTCIASMQTFGELDATTVATVKDAMTEGEQYQLKDSRDGKMYWVAKLADGNIWMTQNLNLTGGTALTSADTDMPDGYTMPTSNGFQSGNKLPASSTSGFSSDTMAYVYNSGNEDANATCNSTTPCHSYYSWTAATLGSGLSISTDNTDAPYSICPKGWKLPTSRTTDASNWQTTSDFYQLAHQYGLDSTSDASEYDNGFYTQAGPGTLPNFQLGGYYVSGSFNSGGSDGYYWSATSTSGAGGARNLSFGSFYVGSDPGSVRRYGFSVRCLAR